MVIDYVNGECHMLNVSSSIMLSNVESNAVFMMSGTGIVLHKWLWNSQIIGFLHFHLSFIIVLLLTTVGNWGTSRRNYYLHIWHSGELRVRWSFSLNWYMLVGDCLMLCVRWCPFFFFLVDLYCSCMMWNVTGVTILFSLLVFWM